MKMEDYVLVGDPTKKWVTDHIVEVLEKECALPVFPAAAMKICTLSQQEGVTLEEFAQVISMDPGLAARSIQVAGSVGFAARPIDSIFQALMIIGLKEIRRVAIAVGALGSLSDFRENADWKRWWIHSILVARLTDKVAASFRRTNGMEYLSGLLHDVGKLFIERYFPKEFEGIMREARLRRRAHAMVEPKFLGLDHTRIGGAITQRLEVHKHVLLAVLYHHDPLCAEHTTDPAGDGGFLAACVAVADALAHQRRDDDTEPAEQMLQIQQLPAWIFLKNFGIPGSLEIDLAVEFDKTEREVSALL